MSDSLVLHSFSIPMENVTLSKAKSGSSEDWIIEGLASTNSLDQQGEVVLVKGLDLSYLDSGRGTFNWNHRGDADPSSVVGIITESRRTDNNELFIKGKLLKSLPKAKHVYDLLKALQKDCPERKMGMSIEGKVLARNGNQIVKAWVKAVALTLDPVNKDTWVSFAKSMEGYELMTEADEPLAAMPVSALEDMMVSYNAPSSEVKKSFDCDLCGVNEAGDSHSLNDEADAYTACPGCTGIHKDFGWDGIDKMQDYLDREEEVQKALVATLNPNHLHSDNPLLPESLETRLRDLGYAGGSGHKFKSAIKRGKRKKRKLLGEKMHKSYSYAEAVERLKSLCPTLSDRMAHQIVDFTLQRLEEEKQNGR